VDFLIECGVPYIKVASMDLINVPFLEYIARTGAPIVLATGMGDMDEIRNAVAAIRNAGNEQLCILHCVSIYPAEPSMIRLRNIEGLRAAFPDCAVGFSDHSLGVEMATAAVALGAAMIEKHMTLDHTKIGMDNQMATEPGEMKRLVEQCNRVYQGLGTEARVLADEELAQRERMRRSIVAARDLPAGTTIQEGDLDAKRPGTGIGPDRMSELIGRTVGRDIEKDMMILEADLT
jgi:N-acetylneuraminate synthase